VPIRHLRNLCKTVVKEESTKTDHLGRIFAEDFGVSIKNHTHFSAAFSKEVLQKSVDQNVVFSPLSISVALSMAAGGAYGSTLDEICSCLKFQDPHELHELSSHLSNVVLADGSANGGPLLSFVNRVWVDQSMNLKKNYRDIVKKHYNSEPISVDFFNKGHEVTVEANKMVENETEGKVKELLPHGSVDKLTKLILANALYFKGTWLNKFESYATKKGKFYFLNGQSVKVPMMTTRKKQIINKVGDCKILCLPYAPAQGHDMRSFSMYFILPDDINGLPELEKKVDLNFLEHHLYQRCEVKVGSFQLPRFKISGSVTATQILKSMGLVLPFSDEEANFTEMVDSDEILYISNVFHQSYVEVNEGGTEAAAATTAFMGGCSLTPIPDPIEDFVADHPFMFVIKEEESGAILFVGHVVNPLDN
ncbi:hypothetical protein KI387_002960, partial [Taxus chinensis]